MKLQTPALLNERNDETLYQAVNENLHASYQAYFENTGFKLSHFYARQVLRGGEYLYTRFRENEDSVYRPWLLTEAGSVFGLMVVDAEKAAQSLKKWLRQGLPPAKGHSRLWQQNPYLSEHGFGEIVQHKPKDELKLSSNYIEID